MNGAWGLVAVLASVHAAAARDVSFRLVARTDRTYATLPSGEQLRYVGPYPVIGEGGEVAFIGGLTSSNYDVLLSAAPGAGPRVVAGGQVSAPGGGAFLGFDGPRVAGVGDVVFISSVGGYDAGLFRASASGVTVETRVADPLPGLPAGTMYSALGSFGHCGGTFAFNGSYGASLGMIMGTGVWAGTAGQLTLLARGGTPAPGFPPGRVFSSIAFFNYAPRVNQAGDVAFFGTLAPFAQGIWKASGGTVSLVVGERLPLPNLPTHTVLGLGEPSINASGTVAFSGMLRDTRQDPPLEPDRFGIWLSRNGAIEPVALSGQPAPGTSATFAQFNVVPYVDLADGDRVAFVGRLTGPGVSSQNNTGIWAGSPGNLRLIARTGEQAPGYPAGTTYAYLNFGLALNAKGQVVFRAMVSGANVVENRGLFCASPYGPTQLLLHGNQWIVPTGESPALVYTINALEEVGGQDGQPSAFNDSGQFVFHAQFVAAPGGPAAGDGIMIVNVPDVCYANCDGSTSAPVLNVNDFGCFLSLFAAGNALANCDGSVAAPILNVNDYVCFLGRFAAGCP